MSRSNDPSRSPSLEGQGAVLLLLLLALVPVVFGDGLSDSTCKLPAARAGQLVAFSLGEAGRRAAAGEASSAEVGNLGGMTRILGGVLDPSTKDIIIVGQVAEGFPPATLDDLVLALRARLIQDAWPRVSIDPTPETAKTRAQAVVLSPGLEMTSFGKKLVDADIALKKLSLEELEGAAEIPSYRALVERAIRVRTAGRGNRIVGCNWLRLLEIQAAVRSNRERPVDAEVSVLTRFWFHSLDTYSVDRADGAFLIRGIRIGVAHEVADLRGGDDGESWLGATWASEEYARLMTEKLDRVAEKYPFLRELDTLFAMTAVAEAIASWNVEDQLRFFLRDYDVPEVETPATFSLVELVASLDRSDGATILVQVSGGIELRTAARQISEGDLAPLRSMILAARPSARALSWPLPLERWQAASTRGSSFLPAEPRGSIASQGPRNLGYGVLTQSVFLGPRSGQRPVPTPGRDDRRRRFSDFMPPPFFPPPPPPLPVPVSKGPDHGGRERAASPDGRELGGIDIDPQIIRSQQDLGGLKRKALNGRTGKAPLVWPISAEPEPNNK